MGCWTCPVRSESIWSNGWTKSATLLVFMPLASKLRTVEPFTPNRAQLKSSIMELERAGGRTGLLDATFIAFKGAEEEREPDSRHVIVLVTDGRRYELGAPQREQDNGSTS